MASTSTQDATRDRAAQPPPREVELKLFVPPSSVARIWSHPAVIERAIGPLRVARIVSRYFDTEARDLLALHMALRLRRSGRVWLQTLKVAGRERSALSARDEWEMTVSGPALELRRLRGTPLDVLGSSRSLAARLRPVFSTTFRRETRRLRLDDGSEVELAFDRGEIVSGRGKAKRVMPICEVEIEVKDGQTPDLMRFASLLAREVALIPLAASKAQRGHRIAAGAPLAPEKTRLPELGGGDTSQIALGRMLNACNEAMLANAHALLEIESSSSSEAARATAAVPRVDDVLEFVHQGRVAIRRMRSALPFFRPVAKGRRIAALDESLRAIGHVFGAARDWDVFVTTTIARITKKIARDIEDRSALAELHEAAESARLDAHHALMTCLDIGAFGATAIAVTRVAEHFMAEPRTGSTIGESAPAWLGKRRRRVLKRSRRIASLDDEQRHDLRVEVRCLRYALDLVEPLYDDTIVTPFRDALTDLQDKLGKLNDLVVADRLMRTLPETPAIAAIRSRYTAWLDQQVREHLPKVAASFVKLELIRPPWTKAADDIAPPAS
jgi:inorganic triphosphatase YgiF